MSLNKFPTEPEAPPHASERHLRTDHLMNDLGGRTARGGALTFASQGFKFFAGIAGTIVLARLLTPEDYGLIGMVAIVTGFVSMFKDMGLSMATVQKSDIKYEHVSTLFWVNVALSFAIMLLTVALSPAVAWFFKEPRLLWITIAYAGGFIFGGLSVQHEALLRRQMRFGALAITEISSALAGFVTAIVLAYFGARYWALVVNQLVMSLVYAVGVWVVCGWRPGLPVRYSGVRSMLAFGGNYTGFSIVNYFGGNLDNLLVGRIWGAAQLGFYAKAYQLLLLPIDQINAPVTAVAMPALSRLTDSPERYRQAYLRILQKLAIITMPGAAFMIATSDWLVALILGPQWSATARIFAVLGFAAFIQPVLNSTGWLFLSQARTRDMLRWGVIDVTLKIISIVAGLRWGVSGVAIGIVIRMYAQAPLLFWYVGRTGPVRQGDFYRAITPIASAALCVLLTLFAFRSFFADVRPLVGLPAAFGLTAVVMLLALSALPKGRSALQDLKSSLFLLVARREA